MGRCTRTTRRLTRKLAMNSLYYSPLLLSMNLMVASAAACTALWYYSRPYRGPGI